MSETLLMPVTTPDRAADDGSPPVPPHGVRRVLLDSGYCLSALVLAVPVFSVVVTLLAAGTGLLVVVGGVVVLSAGVLVARAAATLERLRLRGMQGRRAPQPTYLTAAPGAGPWRRALVPLRDPQSWLDATWALASLVTATLAFALTVAWWALAAAGLTYWFWQRWLPAEEDGETLAGLIGLGDGRGTDSLLNLGIGVVALLTLPLVVRLAAVTHAGLGSALLCARAELQLEVRRVEGGRDAARVAEADSLRRLERDLHDGPQQRLVRLTMDLGRARRQLTQDPDRVGETLDAALVQARDTVEELRALSRGIAPPLLVDRGLVVALAEMTRGSSVPVESSVDLRGPLAPHVETAVYFVAAEALTNVAKHSRAGQAWLEVRQEEDEVLVRVGDDGVGGAHPAKGSGLAGLQQRLAGVDGRLEVRSPEGGPTVLMARIPVTGR